LEDCLVNLSSFGILKRKCSNGWVWVFYLNSYLTFH
jgi:hypothetical protein